MSITTLVIIGLVIEAFMSIPKDWMEQADDETKAYLADREPRAYHYALIIFFIIYITTLFT